MTDLLDENGRSRGVCARDALSGETLPGARRQRRQRHRRVGRPPAPRGAARRGRGAAHPPLARHARHARPRRRSRSPPGRSCPRAAGARSSRCRGWGRRSSAPPTTSTTRTTSTTCDRPRTTSTTCSARSTPTSASTLGRGDVTGAYAGVRPLISTGDPKKSVDISRKAELYETSSGMITITGGKLTTWRRMAKMAVDRLVEREARTAPCRTHEVPLGQAVDAARLPRVEGVPEEAYERLAGRYGHAAHEVLAVAGESGELAQPIVAGGPADLLAEAVYAARREQAVSVGDVLLRRTRIGPARGARRGRPGRRHGAARRGGDGGRAGLGRRTGPGRGGGLPRRGRRRGHRRGALARRPAPFREQPLRSQEHDDQQQEAEDTRRDGRQVELEPDRAGEAGEDAGQQVVVERRQGDRADDDPQIEPSPPTTTIARMKIENENVNWVGLTVRRYEATNAPKGRPARLPPRRPTASRARSGRPRRPRPPRRRAGRSTPGPPASCAGGN